MKNGLSTDEVNERTIRFGYNELPSEKPKNILRIAFEVIKEPMFLLLISCGGLYIILGNVNEGIILLSTIFIIIFITFYQYQKTEKALNSLKHLSAPLALVLRNGIETKIPGREIVPDDIIILFEGDRIIADGMLLEANNLTIDESILTGESVPVVKDLTNEKDPKHQQVFSGTLVLQGNGIFQVTTTGLETKLGKIGRSLLSIKQDQTRMHKEMKHLIRNLFIFGICISSIIIVAYYIFRGNFIESLLNGLASAMAILPEEFPVVLTVFLALGAWRLSKKNVLTRKPSAIETLGSTTVLCTDKTGTITQNKMEVGLFHLGDDSIPKEQFVAKKDEVGELIKLAKLASQDNSKDPMEKALEKTHQQINSSSETSYELVKEYPLTKSLFAMTRIVKDKNNSELLVATKGAPEAIFTLCKLSKEETTKQLAIVESIAKQGFRVIAVAHSELTGNEIPASQTDIKLNFLGLIGLIDPIRKEVPQAIKECHAAGIEVIMITGDFPATAKNIANQIGLDTSKRLMTGDELTKLSDTELKQIISDISIFARVVPDQKLRIVQALKANKEIVAMTGDGVNDAPALKTADIGVSMGKKGTDVAREASALVLLDDNFASIVGGIRLGRKIFDNLQKAMTYIIAIHIPIIGLTILPAFFPKLPILLMPLHIVLLELIIDPVCSIAFEHEQEEKDIMQRKPRDSNEKFFGGKKILLSALQGLLLLTMTLSVYFIALKEGHSNEEVRAIAFSSLVLGNIFLIITNLSKTRNFLKVITEKNWAVWIIISIAILLLTLIITIPFLQKLFNFENPGIIHFIPSVIGAFSVLIVLEVVKFVRMKR